jgi:hypothetical protein
MDYIHPVYTVPETYKVSNLATHEPSSPCNAMPKPSRLSVKPKPRRQPANHGWWPGESSDDESVYRMSFETMPRSPQHKSDLGLSKGTPRLQRQYTSNCWWPAESEDDEHTPCVSSKSMQRSPQHKNTLEDPPQFSGYSTSSIHHVYNALETHKVSNNTPCASVLRPPQCNVQQRPFSDSPQSLKFPLDDDCSSHQDTTPVLSDAQMLSKVPENAQDFYAYINALMEKFSEDLSAKLRQHVKAWDEDLKALCNDTMSTHEDFQLSPTVTNNGRARPAPAECSDDDWEYHIPKNLEIVITKTPVSMGYDVSQCIHHDTVQFQHDNQGRVSNQHPAGIEATPASGELMAPPAGSESGQGEKEGGDQPPPCKTPRCQNGGASNLKPGVRIINPY